MEKLVPVVDLRWRLLSVVRVGWGLGRDCEGGPGRVFLKRRLSRDLEN